MKDETRPETCQECKYYFDCRKGSIANAYGGLECAEKWSKKPDMKDELREEFEKEFPYLLHAYSDEKQQYCDSMIEYIFHGYTAGRSTADAEIEELKETIANTAQYQAGFRSGRNTLQAQNKKLIEALTLIRHICFTARTGHYTRPKTEREDILTLAEQALKEK
jgi:hypothetical protein